MFDDLFERQQRARARVAATTAAERIDKIHRLEKGVLARRDEIREAMHADFRKPPPEVDLSEIYTILSEGRHARKNLRKWMKPRGVSTPLALIGSWSTIIHEPKGVALILSPWNFPFNLTFGPLISAIAAGNTAIVKPSELTPHSSACMRRIIADLYPEDEVSVLEGGADVATALLAKPFDHIFFTGSPAVGKIVMKAAAEHLTPVTLELGGKSPVIVDRSADIRQAAERVVWGKFLNGGQVCIAPDYVLVDRGIHDEFVAEVQRAVHGVPAGSGAAIVNDRHAARINELIESAVRSGAKIVTGGPFHGRDASPTVLTGVAPQSGVMNEEIFGPVLPIVAYGSLEEAITMITARPKPLAMYIFARNRNAIDTLISRTSAGGTVINHTLIHFYQLNLPFGGVGNSGMGRGHGRFGFEAFSNARGILEQRSSVSAVKWLAPPYTVAKKRLIDFLIRFL